MLRGPDEGEGESTVATVEYSGDCDETFKLKHET